MAAGTVGWDTYVAYLRAAGGFIVCGLVVIWFIAQSASAAFTKYWLGHWLSEGDGVCVFRLFSFEFSCVSLCMCIVFKFIYFFIFSLEQNL